METASNNGDIQNLLDNLNLNRQPTNDELKVAVAGAIKDRAVIYYFIWKTIKRLHPEIDADEIMREASADAGRYKGKQWGKIGNAQQAIRAQSSKTGYLVFEQEFTQLEDSYAEKTFRRCPHMDAFRELGCTEEEMSQLCQNMLSYGDYGNFEPHTAVHMEFQEQISKGDPVCRMCIQNTYIKETN